MTDLSALATALSNAQKDAVLAMSNEWQAGPTMTDEVIAELRFLQDAGLVERRFGDFGDQINTESADGFQVRLQACWWFRLHVAGVAVRDQIAKDRS